MLNACINWLNWLPFNIIYVMIQKLAADLNFYSYFTINMCTQVSIICTAEI